jgi:tetratricopeptide (TPR) repeat protein
VLVLADEGRISDARDLAAKLAALDPYPPFYYFDRGVAAMKQHDYASAKAMFQREIERDAYYHEFHAWLGAAYLGMGESAKARSELALALDNSATRAERDIYAAKLDRIRLQQPGAARVTN